MIDLAKLPDDVDILKAIIRSSQGIVESQNGIIKRKEDRIQHLEQLLLDFKRAFGARSEKINPEQYELALEDIETAMAAIHAEDEAVDPPKSKSASRKPNRGHLPKHLPRIENIIEPEDKTCACGGKLHVIGEDVSERLDVIPAQFRVIVTRRPKYACRKCEDGITQMPAPAIWYLQACQQKT